MIVNVGEFRNDLPRFLSLVSEGTRVVIADHEGDAVAGVVSTEDLLLLMDVEDAQITREALEAYRSGETVPWEEVKAGLKTRC